MIQRRERLRFPSEAGEALVIEREEFGQDLDRNMAIELGVACAINLAHSTFTELVKDAVWPESRADHRVLRKWARARQSCPRCQCHVMSGA